MQEWIAYLGEMILITAVSGMIYTLAPEGALKKHLHFVISLCVLVSLAVPMFSMVEDIPALFEAEYDGVKDMESQTADALTDTLVSVSKKEIEEAIVSYLSEKFDVESSAFFVSLTLDTEDMAAIEITAIDVEVTGISEAMRRRMQSALAEMFLGTETITVSIVK